MNELNEVVTPLDVLRRSIEKYGPVDSEDWLSLASELEIAVVRNKEYLIKSGDKPRNIHFVLKGVLRAYVIGADGKEYNKIFFTEGGFAASIVALMKEEQNFFFIQALEDTTVVHIPFKKYYQLVHSSEGFKNFYLNYLEEHWVVNKEKREIALVLDDATKRYVTFLEDYPGLEQRIAQYHIASHLGITPTQLSRIRKLL